MYTVKEKFTQSNNSLVIKHTLMCEGKQAAVNVVRYEGKFTLTELVRHVDAAAKAAHIAFDPIIKSKCAGIDADYALSDVEGLKLYKVGRNLRLSFKSKLLATERKFEIRHPSDLEEAVGTMLTIVTSGRDLVTSLVYKMALHQRLSRLLEPYFGYNYVLRDMAERPLV